MRTLPTIMLQVLAPFAPLFSGRVFAHVQVLVAGAILTPSKRTVASALRVMGLEKQSNFCRYHRVLNRAKWSGKGASRVLLRLLIEAFAPEGPLVVGIDETLERRRGKKIAAKGIYRDGGTFQPQPARQKQRPAVDLGDVVGGGPVGWEADGHWPFVSALAPSERYCHERGICHKPITERAWELLMLVRHWQPAREIVAVADGGYASLKLLDRCRSLSEPITFITRLRLDGSPLRVSPTP